MRRFRVLIATVMLMAVCLVAAKSLMTLPPPLPPFEATVAARATEVAVEAQRAAKQADGDLSDNVKFAFTTVSGVLLCGILVMGLWYTIFLVRPYKPTKSQTDYQVPRYYPPPPPPTAPPPNPPAPAPPEPPADEATEYPMVAIHGSLQQVWPAPYTYDPSWDEQE